LGAVLLAGFKETEVGVGFWIGWLRFGNCQPGRFGFRRLSMLLEGECLLPRVGLRGCRGAVCGSNEYEPECDAALPDGLHGDVSILACADSGAQPAVE